MSRKTSNEGHVLESADEFNKEIVSFLGETNTSEENDVNVSSEPLETAAMSGGNSTSEGTVTAKEIATEQKVRPSLASHHRVHHHHHHTHRSSSDADRREQTSSNAANKTADDMMQVSEESRDAEAAASKAKKRIPLAAHHRSHRHRSSGEHRHHSLRHHNSYQASDAERYGNRAKTKKHLKGQVQTISIDTEEFERLHNESLSEIEHRRADTVSGNENEPDGVIVDTDITGAERISVEQSEKRPGTETDKVPRLASTILAARESNPRATRKVSTIKSAGSRQRQKKATAFNIIIRVLIGIAVLLLSCVCILFYMRSHGQATMTPEVEEVVIVMPEEEIPVEVENVEDDGKTITYKGEKYRWNENLTTILILGTDRTVEQQEGGWTMAGKNGQADTILLGVIDNTNKKISFININRDTFVPVAEYTSDGDYAGEKKMQICLSYAYGKDNETSCRYTAEAVSKYLYGMPVDYYARLSYDAIPVLNDSVGGVTLTVLEDMTASDATFVLGATVTLVGNQALTYVRSRDTSIVTTNERRIDRQKQYLYAFMKRTIECTRADVTLPLGLYANAQPYMTTNITASQVTYLTSKVLEYGIADDAIRSIPGESVVGEGNHVEYHPDETALYERVLETFYNKVEQ